MYIHPLPYRPGLQELVWNSTKQARQRQHTPKSPCIRGVPVLTPRMHGDLGVCAVCRFAVSCFSTRIPEEPYIQDALARPVQVSQANGVVVLNSYDAVGNLLSMVQTDADGVLFLRHEYSYDDGYRRIQQVETLSQSTITITTTYSYDDGYRLVESVASDGRETSYTFDKAGNRLTQTGVRLSNGNNEPYTISYSYNPANQLREVVDSVTGATTYSYDQDGNRISQQAAGERMSYTYNAEGRLIEAHVEQQIGDTWTHKNGLYEQYTYDGDGRRVRKTTLSATDNSTLDLLTYRYDDLNSWNILQTYNAADTFRFLYDQSLHKLAYTQANQTAYYQNDGLGSILATTDNSGTLDAPDGTMRYGDYGEEIGPESGDVNHDGRNDLLVVHAAWQTLSLYAQSITGTLTSAVAYDLPHTDDYRPLGARRCHR